MPTKKAESETVETVEVHNPDAGAAVFPHSEDRKAGETIIPPGRTDIALSAWQAVAERAQAAGITARRVALV